MNNLLSITSTAANQIKEILKDAPNGVDSIVVGVESSGCSGYSYKIDFANFRFLSLNKIINYINFII